MEEIRNMLTAAVMVGAVAGVIGAVPLLDLCNVCCLWIIAGGFAASYIYGRGKTIEPADGAIIGVLFGLVYGIVVTVMGLLVTTSLKMLTAGAGGLFSEQIDFFGVQIGEPLRTLMLAFFNILLGMVFGAFGGALATTTTKEDVRKPRLRK